MNMNRKTVYIAGKMRGLPNHNIPAFNAAAKRLREQGWIVANPAEISAGFGLLDDPENPNLLAAVMNGELAAIPHMDAIYLLRGWEKSVGAKAELKTAMENYVAVMCEGAECELDKAPPHEAENPCCRPLDVHHAPAQEKGATDDE